MSQKKLPSFQFYPGDWMKDPCLRATSLQARGAWIDMICLMHESPRRGYLQHANGTPWTDDQIARAIGCHGFAIDLLLKELLDCGVLSRTEGGVIYSRRLVRDEELRKDLGETRASAGKIGAYKRWQNDGKRIAKRMAKHGSSSSPSSSPSSSISSSKNPPISPQKGGTGFQATPDQEKEIKILLANRMGHGVETEANRVAYKELVESIQKDKEVRDPMAVAIYRATFGFKPTEKAVSNA